VLKHTRDVDVGRLIGEARRRILTNELFAQGANASSAALAALILLLLLGTEILSWPVVLFVPLAAIGIGLYRVRRRVPQPYGVAQVVDRRLNLADALATAVYFNEVAPKASVNEGVKRAQFEHAEVVARGLDARQAIPFVMPRSAYVMGALVLVASSLFALRYGLTRRLDLKQPLANFLPESLTPGKPTEQARNQLRTPSSIPKPRKKPARTPTTISAARTSRIPISRSRPMANRSPKRRTPMPRRRAKSRMSSLT